jgi:transposase
LGNPIGFHLTPGQASDLEGADAPLPGILDKSDALLADKAYDAQDRVLSLLENAGVQVVIPPKSNRKVQRTYDKDMYKIRHRIENFFAKLKQFRALPPDTINGPPHSSVPSTWPPPSSGLIDDTP